MTDRGKHFICLDVDLARHERIMSLDEPLACLGLFAAMTMHARELLTGGPTGGRVAKRTAETMCGERNRARLKQMVTSGLLNETDTHYEIVKYAPRNQSPVMVEESRRGGRERKAESRARLADVTRDSGVTDGGNEGDPLSTRGRARTSTSPSGFVDSSSPPGVQGGPLPANTDRMVRPSDPMPDGAAEVLARLAMNEFGGVAVRDVSLEWGKFCGHYDGKLWLSQVAGKWQKWITKAWQDQRAENRRERERAARPSPYAKPEPTTVQPRVGGDRSVTDVSVEELGGEV